MFLSITEFLGHLHPVLVHLPIGILLLACLFIWQSRKDKYEHLQPAINTILFLGMISAILSCITGFILSQTGDYDEQLVGLHQWMGISVAAISVLTFLMRKKVFRVNWQFPLSGLLLVLIFITGHLGGSLTHGSDYLTQPLMDLTGPSESLVVKKKIIPDIQQALLYADLVQPVLQGTCYGCHGTHRQKGKLRMDTPEWLMKGGKDGVVIIPGKSEQSLLIKRILLPEEDEHHMAPKEKTQLGEKEIKLLEWWINQGADFTRKVKDFQQPENIKTLLLSLQTDTSISNEAPDIPEIPVQKADMAAIQKLRDRGVVLLPVAQNSNWLDANFITTSRVRDADMVLLLPIRNQLTWLKLGGTRIGDSALKVIGQCTNLIRLQLDHTAITDKGLGELKQLTRLQTLNLVGTAITRTGLMQLTNMKKLKSVYLFQTQVEKKDWGRLEKAFPGVLLDSGGYSIPYLQADTVIVKAPKSKS